MSKTFRPWKIDERLLLPAMAAAADCGFSDQSHMTRLFRRLLGTTPAEYRTSVTS